jgi:hypothetical protein
MIKGFQLNETLSIRRGYRGRTDDLPAYLRDALPTELIHEMIKGFQLNETLSIRGGYRGRTDDLPA